MSEGWKGISDSGFEISKEEREGRGGGRRSMTRIYLSVPHMGGQEEALVREASS